MQKEREMQRIQRGNSRQLLQKKREKSRMKRNARLNLCKAYKHHNLSNHHWIRHFNLLVYVFHLDVMCCSFLCNDIVTCFASFWCNGNDNFNVNVMVILC